MSEIDKIKEQVRFYADFPKKGINFIDILPLLSDSETFRTVIYEINKYVTSPNVAAPEARGFLFAAPLLMIDGGGVENIIAFRKNAKLPAEENDLIKVPIVKEYGDDSLYFRRSDIERASVTEGKEPVIEITIFDDILATGGTSEGMCEELNSLRVRSGEREIPVRVKEFVFIAEIGGLKGKERLEKFAPVRSLITF